MPVADKPASEMSADELWSTVTGVTRSDSDWAIDPCPYCSTPVTNAQISDGDAFPIDERGVDDQKYAHRECAQARYEP